jgi:hypothetical protein
MATFATRYRPHRQLLVGSGGIPIADFLARPVTHWFEK